VKAYEREGIAGICIEDNVFPKRCSFYAGVKRELADAEEHARKVRACVDTRRDDDFVVIARTEALIAGWGMDEALRRARAYADAGADLVLIHSKSESPDEVLEFASKWDRPAPLVCVPTIYKAITASELAKAGFRIVIYANHGLRSSIRAMKDTFARLMKEQRCAAVEDRIATLEEVYEVVGVSDMKREEKAYLPAGGKPVGAVILAAGASPELGDLTADRPKAMLEVRGKSVLERQVEALNQAGVKEISVVVGWKKEAVTLPNLRKYAAPDSAGEVASLLAATPELGRRTLVLYGDILFDPALLERLLQSDGDVVLVVDRAEPPDRPNRDLVLTEHPVDPGGRFLPGSDAVRRIGRDLAGANGEWIGMLMLSEEGAKRLQAAHARLAREGAGRPVHQARDLATAALTDLIQVLVDEGVSVRAIDTYKGWTEIDSFEDYRRAWNLVR
jgi:phosphoenolpyruvate phosphomutase